MSPTKWGYPNDNLHITLLTKSHEPLKVGLWNWGLGIWHFRPRILHLQGARGGSNCVLRMGFCSYGGGILHMRLSRLIIH